jgi:putative membrane protein
MNTRIRTVALIVVSALILPVLAGALMGWTWSGRAEASDQVPVAIVNEDEIITGDTPMAAGRALTSELVHPDEAEAELGWVLTDADDAQAGLEDGTYYAVLTIPEDFSADVLSVSGDDPQKAELTLETDAGASASTAAVSEAVATAAGDALGRQVTGAYLETVYDGLNDVHDSLGTASDGADQVDGGADQLATATSQSAQGAHDLADGTTSLADGVGSLATGADGVADGAARLATGTDDVADGAAQLNDGTAGLASGAAELARSTQSLASGSTDLADAAASTASGAQEVSGAAADVAAGSDELAGSLTDLAAACPQASQSAQFCAQLTTAAKAGGTVADGAQGVAGGTASVADGAQGVSGGTASVAEGAQAASAGATSVAQGATDIDQAAGQVASGASALTGPADELTSGARTLADGATDATGSASALADGASSLADGSDQITQAATSLAGGTGDLAGSLAEGAKSAPQYDDAESEELADVVAEPIALTTQDAAPEPSAVIAVVGAALALWVGAGAALLVGTDRIRRDALRSTVGTARLLRLVLLPRLGLASVQGLAVTAAVLAFAPVEDVVGFGLLTVLGSVAFTLVATGLGLWWGKPGKLVLLGLVVLQVCALGLMVPAETAPPVLQAIRSGLPVVAFIEGTASLGTGSGTQPVAVTAAVLAVWALVGLAATAVGVRRLRSAPSLRM